MRRVYSTHSANITWLRFTVHTASATVYNPTLLLHDDEQDAVTDVEVRRSIPANKDLSLITASCMSVTVCLARRQRWPYISIRAEELGRSANWWHCLHQKRRLCRSTPTVGMCTVLIMFAYSKQFWNVLSMTTFQYTCNNFVWHRSCAPFVMSASVAPIIQIEYSIMLNWQAYCTVYAYAKRSHKLRNVSAQKIQTKYTMTWLQLCHCMPRSKFHNLYRRLSEWELYTLIEGS